MSSAVLERALHVISSATELSVARITSALRDVIKDRAIPVPSMSKSPAPAGKHFWRSLAAASATLSLRNVTKTASNSPASFFFVDYIVVL